MTPFRQWQKRWRISDEAVRELYVAMAAYDQVIEDGEQTTEGGVQDACRLAVSRLNGRAWRNNNGAAKTEDGRFIRYGLANTSKKVNENLKSSDLICCLPYTVKPNDVGTKIGVFGAFEIKRPGWRYTGTDRERAQMNFLKLVASMGGIATFVNDAEYLKRFLERWLK